MVVISRELMISSSCTCFENPLRISETLIQEEIHFFQENLLFKEKKIPLWLIESMADYFSTSEIAKNGIMKFGKINYNLYEHPLTQFYRFKGKKYYKQGILHFCLVYS